MTEQSTSDSMPSKEEMIAILLQAMGESDEAKSAITAMVRDASKQAKVAKQVKQFKRVTVITHCLHCQAASSREVTLQPDERRYLVDEEGDTYTIKASEQTTYDTYTASCERCPSTVSRWSRTELESRYLTLLERAGHTLFTHTKQAKSLPPPAPTPASTSTSTSMRIWGDVPHTCQQCWMYDGEMNVCRKLECCDKLASEGETVARWFEVVDVMPFYVSNVNMERDIITAYAGRREG